MSKPTLDEVIAHVQEQAENFEKTFGGYRNMKGWPEYELHYLTELKASKYVVSRRVQELERNFERARHLVGAYWEYKDCGPYVAVDEDGLCASCGADCEGSFKSVEIPKLYQRITELEAVHELLRSVEDDGYILSASQAIEKLRDTWTAPLKADLAEAVELLRHLEDEGLEWIQDPTGGGDMPVAACPYCHSIKRAGAWHDSDCKIAAFLDRYAGKASGKRHESEDA